MCLIQQQMWRACRLHEQDPAASINFAGEKTWDTGGGGGSVATLTTLRPCDRRTDRQTDKQKDIAVTASRKAPCDGGLNNF